MADSYVRSHTDQLGINTIEFFHPQSNSLPSKLLAELAQEIHHAGLNADTKVIVLKSAGSTTFCAGASFDELAAITTQAGGKIFFSGFAILAVQNLFKFYAALIAAITNLVILLSTAS